MTHIKARLLPYAVMFTLATIAASPAFAQNCPADVSDLAPEIDEPQLQARLSEPLDSIVSDAGGLQAAIGQWEQKLADAQAQRAQFNQSPPAVDRAFEELVLILNRQLAGLRCRAE